MLSIRTQDRMALVPYNAKIKIECNTYKVSNKKEIEEATTFNKKLMEKIKYEKQYGNKNNFLTELVTLVDVDKEYKKHKKEEPEPIYNEWNIKYHGENGYGVIGTYNSKERALEVLDEIQQILDRAVIFEMPKE